MNWLIWLVTVFDRQPVDLAEIRLEVKRWRGIVVENGQWNTPIIPNPNP